MDIDVTLENIRAAVRAYHRGERIDIDDLIEHVDALDRWLTMGGALPADWDETR